jgi:hypothetical protein
LNKIIRQPYLFFFGLSIITFVASYIYIDKSLDSSFYVTYFVISYKYICQFLALFFIMIALNYFALNWIEKHPNKWLTITHLFLQILSLLLLITKDSWNWIGNNSLANYNPNNNANFLIFLSFFIFIISIFVHLVNFFTSLLLKRN